MTKQIFEGKKILLWVISVSKSATFIIRVQPELKQKISQGLERVNMYLTPSQSLTFTTIIEDYLKVWAGFQEWLYQDHKKAVQVISKQRPRLSQAGFFLLMQPLFIEYLNTVEKNRLKEKLDHKSEDYKEFQKILAKFNGHK